MSINFIPNDPRVISNLVAQRQVNPRPNRPSNRAGYTFFGVAPEGEFATGTPEFLFWQCREAALASIDVWEQISGGAFTSWQSGKKLELRPDDGENLNAFYDRVSLSFFHKKVGTKTFFSGASTDVVAHEAGHGFLDAIRPEFIVSNMFEVNAFHESFGDCIAILTALFDSVTRTAVLAKLNSKNGVESTAEELSFAIGQAFPGHNAGVPRTGLNTFQWSPPSTLPASGGPGVLISEIHSFGQVFNGCFYDVIRNIFERLGGATSEQLLEAATIAGKLLVQAASEAPLKTQFFREVGRALLLNDQENNGGANVVEIRNAFQSHGIALGSSVMLAPSSALAGASVAVGKIAAAVKKDLLGRLRSSTTAKITATAEKIAGKKVTEVIHDRLVELGSVHAKLKGVVALAQESILMGSVNKRAVVLGEMPEAESTVADVEHFVKSLVDQGAILFDKPKASLVAQQLPSAVTHVVQTVKGQKTLVRIRYSCDCPQSLR